MPTGAIVAPVILASNKTKLLWFKGDKTKLLWFKGDKTKLSQFKGDKTAWPVYLSIGNIVSSTQVFMCLFPRWCHLKTIRWVDTACSIIA